MNNFQEAFDMFMVLGECRKNYRNAENLYARRYPDRQRKSHMAFMRLANRFRRFGSVREKRARRQPIVNDTNAAGILAFVAVNPHASSRQMERESGISRRSVLRILHQHKFHPYHISLQQDLDGDDFMHRVNFCNWVNRKMREDHSFITNVLFSDEANFTNNGNVNRHNMHYWAEVNPRWTRSVPFQHPWSLNVWCGIIGDYIIGPYFFEGRLTGQIYADFLRNVLPQLLENVPLNTRLIMWMQQDGAPPHYARCSREVMDELFPEKWIGRRGPVPWPPRSPDLTSLDFFLWGFIKERVMAVAPTTPEDMKARIRQACTQITPEMLAAVRSSFRVRVNKCLQVEGHHFEHLIK